MNLHKTFDDHLSRKYNGVGLIGGPLLEHFCLYLKYIGTFWEPIDARSH